MLGLKAGSPGWSWDRHNSGGDGCWGSVSASLSSSALLRGTDTFHSHSFSPFREADKSLHPVLCWKSALYFPEISVQDSVEAQHWGCFAHAIHGHPMQTREETLMFTGCCLPTRTAPLHSSAPESSWPQRPEAEHVLSPLCSAPFGQWQNSHEGFQPRAGGSVFSLRVKWWAYKLIYDRYCAVLRARWLTTQEYSCGRSHRGLTLVDVHWHHWSHVAFTPRQT